MGSRMDPPRQVFAQDALSSAGAPLQRMLAVAPQPKTADALPERYGTPALELLVVDPANVFISWEITEGQLGEARNILGSPFDRRVLCVDIRVAEDPGEMLAHTELFGDTGRWFLSVPPVGCEIKAELYYDAGGNKHHLLTAGPVALPRISVVEPEGFEELHVAYSLGPGGRLALAGINRAAPQPAPGLGIEPAPPGQPGSARLGVAGSSQQWSGAWHTRRGANQGANDD